jgi:hypothetical protein
MKMAKVEMEAAIDASGNRCDPHRMIVVEIRPGSATKEA